MKKMFYCLLILFLVALLAACKKDKNNSENNEDITVTVYPGDNADHEKDIITPSNQPTITPEAPPENHEGEMRSFLTGLWVPEEIGSKRPYAMQFSNFKTVSNQWGIMDADIVYEALVEGGITRLLGIGENYTGDSIGSIRSSRHYFASFADEYDAIYIHYGKTKYAKAKLKEIGIDNLDGETGIGNTVFYRDKSMKAPHNAFTSYDRIIKGISIKGYETQYKKDYEPHFLFYEEDTAPIKGDKAEKVKIKYSSYISPYFIYNEKDKLYYRYQFNDEHKDSVTGDPLSFKNIIIQFVKEWDIDKNDYQTMDIEDASGSGYYITNKIKMPITWKKNENNKWMRYYDKDGNELTINTGKTYISIFPDNRTGSIDIK